MSTIYEKICNYEKTGRRCYVCLSDGKCYTVLVREIMEDFQPDENGERAWSVCFDDSKTLFSQDDVLTVRSCSSTVMYEKLAELQELDSPDDLYPLDPYLVDEFLDDTETSEPKLVEILYTLKGESVIRTKWGREIHGEAFDIVDIYDPEKEIKSIDIGVVIKESGCELYEVILLSDIKNATTKRDLYFAGNYTMIDGERGYDEADPKKIRRAMRSYEAAVGYGDCESLLDMAELYAYGHIGVEKDRRKALDCLLKAAAYGDARAFCQLGDFYKYRMKNNTYTSIKSKSDLQHAFEYYSIGAGMWERKSTFELGDFYRDGVIVERDTDMAVYLYARAINDERILEYGDDWMVPAIELRLAECMFFGWGMTADRKLAKKKVKQIIADVQKELPENTHMLDRAWLNQTLQEALRIQAEME